MKSKLNELLLVIYVFLFPVMGVVTRYIPGHSKQLLLLSAAMIMLISLHARVKNRDFSISPFYMLTVATVVMMFAIDAVLRPNSYTFTYLYQFTIFGIFPMYLLTRVRDVKSVLRYFATFSVATIVLYASDPFSKYPISGDYLGFGYAAMLPAYCGCYIGRKYLKIGYLRIFELVALAELVVFANRGATLTAIVFVFFCMLVVDKRSKQKIRLIATLSCLAIVLTINLRPILAASIAFVESKGLYSYSLSSLYDSVNGGHDTLSGRDVIWGNAGTVYDKSPIVGSGVGYFISKYNVYTHNILLEILTSWGVIGLLFFITFVFAYIYNLTKTNGEVRVLMLLLIVLGLVPLFFSKAIFEWIYFWLFVAGIILKRLQPSERN